MMPLEWKQSRYGEQASAMLAPGLRLIVEREMGVRGGPPAPWRVYVFEAKLERQYDTEDGARAAALRVGRKWLAQAMERLTETVPLNDNAAHEQSHGQAT